MRKSSVKVSICVPIYNVEEYIVRCLESLISQTFTDIEIIVVNDCTPDNSMSLVYEYAKRDDRIIIVEHNENKGLMRSRQTGYMKATGDYITFCDSDDTMPSNAIELLLSQAVHTGADIVSGDIDYIDENNNITHMVFSLGYGNKPKDVYFSLLEKKYGHNLCSKLFKRDLLQKHDYITYDHFTNGEDGCLFYQVVKNANFIQHINNPVYNYFQNKESSSQVRMSLDGLRSVCFLNKMRVSILGKDSTFKLLLSRYISEVFADLYYAGYNKNRTLDFMLKEEGLSYYATLCCYLRYFSFPENAKMLLKRYIIRRSI